MSESITVGEMTRPNSPTPTDQVHSATATSQKKEQEKQVRIPQYETPHSDDDLQILEVKLGGVLAEYGAAVAGRAAALQAVNDQYKNVIDAHARHAKRIAQKILGYVQRNRARLLAGNKSIRRPDATERFSVSKVALEQIATDDLIRELESRRYVVLEKKIMSGLRNVLSVAEPPIPIHPQPAGEKQYATFGLYNLRAPYNMSRRLFVPKGEKAKWDITSSTRDARQVTVEEG